MLNINDFLKLVKKEDISIESVDNGSDLDENSWFESYKGTVDFTRLESMIDSGEIIVDKSVEDFLVYCPKINFETEERMIVYDVYGIYHANIHNLDTVILSKIKDKSYGLYNFIIKKRLTL